MEQIDLIGIAAVITAITGPAALILVALLDRKVTHIDHAVNGKEPGAQSMVSQVDDIHKNTEILTNGKKGKNGTGQRSDG